MATLPTPKDTALNILDTFVNHFKCRPTDVLKINNFLAVWHKKGLYWDDFVPGMEYAGVQKWVEPLSDGKSFKLTEQGFAACSINSASISSISNNKPITINKNYINIVQAINSPITQGIGSTQTVTTNYILPIAKDELVDFVNSFRENISELNLSSQEERKVNAQLATIEAQLIDEPNREIIKEVFASLKNVTESAIGSLLATAAQSGVWGAIKLLLSYF